MEKNINNIHEKSIWNAISSYFFIFLAWLFYFNKTNPYINNDFVKSHVKTASLIHLWFLITIIVFVISWVFESIIIIWLSLNFIIATTLCILLLWVIMIWIYKAKNGLEFNISKKFNISKSKDILDINWDWNITEKEKLTILLSYIPFLWFITFGKYKDNNTIKNITRINILTTLAITLLYIFWYLNLATLLSLIYIILITFTWINLFSRNELIQINISKYFSPEKLYILVITLKDYLKNYFKNIDFIDFEKIEKENEKYIKKRELEEENILKTKKELNISKKIIYIPIINLIFLFYKNTRYSYHIINWITITIILIIMLILSNYGYINKNIYSLLLFPILFWMWYTNNRLAYRIPIIFDIYLLFKKIISVMKIWSKKVNDKRKEKKEVNLKVK